MRRPSAIRASSSSSRAGGGVAAANTSHSNRQPNERLSSHASTAAFTATRPSNVRSAGAVWRSLRKRERETEGGDVGGGGASTPASLAKKIKVNPGTWRRESKGYHGGGITSGEKRKNDKCKGPPDKLNDVNNSCPRKLNETLDEMQQSRDSYRNAKTGEPDKPSSTTANDDDDNNHNNHYDSIIINNNNKEEEEVSPKRPSDQFLQSYLPRNIQNIRNVQNIQSIANDIEGSLLLGMEVGADVGGGERSEGGVYGGGGVEVMSQLTVGIGTQQYMSARDEESEMEEEKEEVGGTVAKEVEVLAGAGDTVSNGGEGVASPNEGGDAATQKKQQSAKAVGTEKKQSSAVNQDNNSDDDYEKDDFMPSDDDADEAANNARKQTALAAAVEETSNATSFNPINTKANVKKRGRKFKGPTFKALAEADNGSGSEEDDQMDHGDDAFEEEEDLLETDDGAPNAAEAAGPNAMMKEEEDAKPSETTTLPIEVFIDNIARDFENMGKALTCPICQHSLRKATILPCRHAFCHSCLTQAFNPSSSGAATKGKKKNSPTHVKLECSVCREKVTRRSMTRVEQLDDLVRAYKMTARDFGFAPHVHNANVTMTQLDPEENAFTFDDESEEDERKMPAEGGNERHYSYGKKKFDVTETTQHLQVTRVVRDAITSKSKQLQSSPETKTAANQNLVRTKEDFERQAMARRYQFLARDADAVVRADEEALEKATRRKQMIVSATAAVLGVEDVAKKSAPVESSGNLKHEKIASTTTTEMAEEPLQEKDLGKATQETFQTCRADLESLEYATAKEGSHQANDDVLNTTAPSPTVLHDGNTAKKANRKSSRASSLEDVGGRDDGKAAKEANGTTGATKRRNHSFATFATGDASPIVLHDGNTLRKSRVETSNNHPTPRRSGKIPSMAESRVLRQKKEAESEHDANDDVDFGGEHDFADDDEDRSPVPEGAAACVGVKSSQDSSVVSEESEGKPPANAKTEELTAWEEIAKGSVVIVKSRTWPGINKHGGVGRVTKVNVVGNATKYDVTYVLGGREKDVDASFVSLHGEMASIEASSHGESKVSQRTSRSTEKIAVRPMRQRKVAETIQPAPVPIYNDEVLKHIPAETLQWAGIKPLESRSKGSNSKGSKSRKKAKKAKVVVPKEASDGKKKRGLAEHNSNTTMPAKTKKQKGSSSSQPKEASTATNPTEPVHDAESFRTIIDALSTEEVVRRADERYASLLLNAEILNVVTSSLEEKDSDVLYSLSKMLKSKNGEHLHGVFLYCFTPE